MFLAKVSCELVQFPISMLLIKVRVQPLCLRLMEDCSFHGRRRGLSESFLSLKVPANTSNSRLFGYLIRHVVMTSSTLAKTRIMQYIAKGAQ